MPTELEMKKKVDTALNLIHEFKSNHDEAIKKNEEKTGEHEQKLSKLADDIASVIELKEKVDRLAALSNQEQKSVEIEREKKEREMKECFEGFIRNTNHNNIELKEHFLKEQKALSVDSNPDGGYLVIPTFDRIRKTREFETSPIRRYASIMSISSDSLEIPVDQDEATSGGWVGETASRSNTATPQINKISIPVHEQYAQPLATQKSLDDIALDVESWLAGKVTDILGRTENTSFVSGNGVAKPQGFLSYTAWTTNGTYEFNKIEQRVSGAATNFTADGLIDLQNDLKEAYQANAVFMTKRTNFKNIMKLKYGTGEYIFNRAMDQNVGQPFSLLGQPLVFADDMPAVAANALSMVYGDFKAAYQIVDRIGIRIIRDIYTNKPYVIFYTTKRVGGGVVNFEALKIQKISA